MLVNLDIEIFFNSDEINKRIDTGMEYSVLECDTRTMTFYDIACLAPYEDEKSGQWFCIVYSGGKEFIATKNIDQIKIIILKNRFP